jgi:hypothetical protein
MPNQIDITDGVQIVSILDTSYFFDEKLFKEGMEESRYMVKHDTGFNPDSNLFNLTLTFSYTYYDPKEIFASITVENTFLVPNLKSYLNIDTKQMALPGSILLTCLGMAVSHTRALLNKNLKGTVFQYFLIPVINVVGLANQLFYRQDNEALTVTESKIPTAKTPPL